MDAPFIALFFFGSVAALAFTLLSRAKHLRDAGLLGSSVLFCLGILETSAYYTSKPHLVITDTTPRYWREDAASLGPLPLPATATRFKEFLDGQLISSVTYVIDRNRLREIPPSVQGRPYKVAFFGCSFMFGHGVENDQTLPYYFIKAAKGTFEGFNFAGEGWGPHQMLRAIETGFVRRVAGVPDLAVYEAIPDHLRRVAGRAPWESGPRYCLCAGNQVCYAGPVHGIYYRTLHYWLDKSWIMRFVENYFPGFSRPSDIPLFLAVLNKSRRLLAANRTHFVIVMWDQNELGKTIVRTLRENRFDVIGISSIIDGAGENNIPLTQLDGHPSAAANKAIASYLWEQVGETIAESHHSLCEWDH